jgi:hypothetical protein
LDGVIDERRGKMAGNVTRMVNKAFVDWVKKFKIDKIPLTEEEWRLIEKGFSELYYKIKELEGTLDLLAVHK